MSWNLVLVAVLLLVGSGPLQADAADCVAVWVDTRGQVAECKAVDLQAQLRQHPRVCPAVSAEKAVVTVLLTSCREQVPAAVTPPGLTVAGREFAVRAQATEGKAAKELAGLNGDSWAGAARDLCRAIAVWHTSLADPK
jgi:hypothetical protein